MIILLFFTAINQHKTFAQEDLLKAAKLELQRAMESLKKEQLPPYFISLNITETYSLTLSSSFGNLRTDNESRKRYLDIDLRVGDYEFDNTHIIRGEAFSFGSWGEIVELPIENNPEAIRTAIWNAINKEYKSAVERYQKALTNRAVKVKEEDTSADFSKENPITYIGKPIKIEIDKDYWANRIKKLSAQFIGNDWLYSGNARFSFEINNKYFISTEGSELYWVETGSRIGINAYTKADDGMTLPLYKSYFAFHPDNLPKDELIENDIKNIIKLLSDLRNAPLAEPFSGPAILSGEASGVFFHEIFGHRVEGHREKDPNQSQTFKNQVGNKILPEFINVIFDPTLKAIDKRELSGYYPYDDEGVKSQKVVSVEKGVFKNFLMSRSPIEGFPNSNGHGRKQVGYKAVSRQSNLIVEATEKVPVSKLKDMLREECKKQNKPYGLLFDVVQGGFTFTGRTIPNAFNVDPIIVYKVYPDGRPDELVRGVDLIGTPLATFANILKAGDDIGIFNGICGAESGGVPVSAVSPSLLVSLIEVQRKQKSQAKPPILPAPTTKGIQ